MAPDVITLPEPMTPADRYESVIGLEIHAQLLTASKAFCGCSADFGSDPNTSVCPICLGMPGTLPVLNIRLVDSIIRMGLAVECTIASRSVFARKNYFYPDLPKGYQISQFEAPICTGGGVEIELQDGSRKRIGITRIHMEEDAGKSIHDQGAETLVDINRCGVPLIEIVSEPEMRSPAEAVAYLAAIRQLVTYLGICDGNMEEGSLRCDANVSVRQRGERALGTKTEVKNMNSFRNVERALAFEIQRQIGVLDDGGRIVQETLLWDADRNVAFPMRSKEEAHDYRYFPEPDLVPLAVDASWIARAKASLPELPAARRARFMEEFGLPRYDAGVLTADRSVADYFEETVSLLNLSGTRPTQENAKAASNWVMTDVLRVIGPGASGFPVTPRRLASLIGMVQEGRISGSIGRRVFDLMVTDTALPEEIVQQQGLAQVSDAAAIERAVEEVLGAHAGQVGKYLGGAEKIFGFFVGETMRQLKGKGNPKLIHEILKQKLAAQRRA